MLTNSVVRGSQGTVVCIFYCVISPDVRMIMSKKLYQFQVRRETLQLTTMRSNEFQKSLDRFEESRQKNLED